jgi:hypothetical protein
MANYFSTDHYSKPTRFGAARGVALGVRLIKAAPAELHERPRAALTDVRGRTVDLQALLRERLRVTKSDMGDIDAVLDGAWVGLRMALEALTKLTARPVSKEAAEVLRLALPHDTGFVTAAFEVQWNESETHLKRIEEDGLDARITALAGAEFMPAIRDGHAAFADALGLGDAPVESKEAVAISGAIADLTIAIAEYGRILSGELDRKDAASIDAFKKAMAPIDGHRAWLASRRTGATAEEVETEEDVIGEDVDLSDPVPPLPIG